MLAKDFLELKRLEGQDVDTRIRLALKEQEIGQHCCQAGESLSDTELTVLKALARGLSNKAISRELWVSEETVKFHLGNVYRKLGVPNRLAAASIAHARGLAAA